jgi:hypothetical protein
VLDDLPLADLGVMTIDNVDRQRRYSSFVYCGRRFYLRRIDESLRFVPREP